MKPLLIVKTGGTFPEMADRFGDFDDWFVQGLDPTDGFVDTVRPFLGEPLPPPASLGGVIITGSHDMVTDAAPWSEKTAVWVNQAVSAAIPLLGVCYGHQLLAHAMGGVVGDNPNGKEFGTVSIRLNAQGLEDRLFSGLPDSFPAQACHSQSVLQLPSGATLLASSTLDPHQAFAIGQCAWGVQFHPEFSPDVQRHYIKRFADALKAQGCDVDALQADVHETPASQALLQRFQGMCL